MPYRVAIIEAERGWGMKVDSVKYFADEQSAWAFEKAYNADNSPRVNGRAPDWYMQAENPKFIESLPPGAKYYEGPNANA